MPDADWLKEHKEFQGLTFEDTRNLGAFCIEQTFPKDALIVEQGTVTPGGGFIRSGSARVTVRIKGADKALNFLRVGEFYGEMSLMEPEIERSASLVAAAPTTVLSLPYAQYLKLKREHPTTVFRLLEIFLRITGRRLRDATKRIH